MKKLIYILLFLPVVLQAQDLKINKSPSAYRMIATNIAAVTFEALADGLRDKAWIEQNPSLSTYGHMSNALATGILLSIPFKQSLTTKEWLTQFVTYTFMRVALFDPIYNYTRGLPLTYIGNSSIWDKSLQAANGGDGFLFMRGVTFLVSISIPLQDLRR